MIDDNYTGKFTVSYRRVGARDTLIGGIIECHEGPFDNYEEAKQFAVAANCKPFTPYFFFVERAE